MMKGRNYAPMLISGSYVSANPAEIQHNNPPTYGGAVDASFDIQKGYTWFASLTGSDASATLTLGAGTLTMDATTTWAGKSVSLTDKTSVLAVNAAANLSQETELTMVTGAKLNFATSCRLYIAKLTVNGTAYPAGEYTAATLPDAITGSGTLVVGFHRVVWTGKGGDTLWTTAANWNPQVVPLGNAEAVFNSAVTLAECAADLTGGTLTIEINNSATVTSSTKFSGTGSVVLCEK